MTWKWCEQNRKLQKLTDLLGNSRESHRFPFRFSAALATPPEHHYFGRNVSCNVKLFRAGFRPVSLFDILLFFIFFLNDPVSPVVNMNRHDFAETLWLIEKLCTRVQCIQNLIRLFAESHASLVTSRHVTSAGCEMLMRTAVPERSRNANAALERKMLI